MPGVIINRQILFGLFFVVFFGTGKSEGFAQNVYRPEKFYIGVRLIPQATFLLNPDDSPEKNGMKPKFSVGYAGGLAIGQDVSKKFGFEAGLLFSRQTQGYVVTDSLTRNATLSFSYIKIPFMLYYHSSREKRICFTAGAGPQLAILTNASYQLEGVAPTETVGYSKYLKYSDLYNPTDISIVLAVGIEARLTDKLRLCGQFRSDVSLVDAENRTLKTPKRAVSRWVTGGLTVGLSYVFGSRQTETPAEPTIIEINKE